MQYSLREQRQLKINIQFLEMFYIIKRNISWDDIIICRLTSLNRLNLFFRLINLKFCFCINFLYVKDRVYIYRLLFPKINYKKASSYFLSFLMFLKFNFGSDFFS